MRSKAKKKKTIKVKVMENKERKKINKLFFFLLELYTFSPLDAWLSKRTYV